MWGFASMSRTGAEQIGMHVVDPTCLSRAPPCPHAWIIQKTLWIMSGAGGEGALPNVFLFANMWGLRVSCFPVSPGETLDRPWSGKKIKRKHVDFAALMVQPQNKGRYPRLLKCYSKWDLGLFFPSDAITMEHQESVAGLRTSLKWVKDVDL